MEVVTDPDELVVELKEELTSYCCELLDGLMVAKLFEAGAETITPF